MRVAVIGNPDVSMWDLGDEAKLRTALKAFGTRGLSSVVFAADAAEAGKRLTGVEIRRGLVFPHPPGDRERYLGEIRAVLGGHAAALPKQDQLFRLLDNIRNVDAVFIDGGELGSPRGWLLYQAAAIALVARHMDKRVVLGAQNLGPGLSRTDAEVARELLAAAEVIGVADDASGEIARILGRADALPLFAADTVVGESGVIPVEERSGVVATLADFSAHLPRPEAVHACARLIDQLIDAVGGEVRMLPQLSGDAGFHRDVAAALASRPETGSAADAPNGSLADFDAAIASAQVVVAMQPHALTAALNAGTPVIALATNHHSRLRLSGILDRWGSAQPVIGLADLVVAVNAGGIGRFTADALAAARQVPNPGDLQEAVAEGWDQLAAALRNEEVPPAVAARPAPSRMPQPGPAGGGDDRVLIVTRTRDRGVLLRRALDDVLAQSYPDWHLVVVNDGGAPEPVDALIAERAEGFADRVSVIHHAESVGMEAASNVGARSRDSEFIVIHDDDDTWHPDFLARTVAHLSDPDNTDGGVMVRTEIVFERIEGDEVIEEDRAIFWADIHEITLHDLIKVNRAVPISLLYRRKVHDEIGWYDEALPAVGDWVFHLRLLQATTVGFIDGDPLAYWNQRPNAAGPLGNSVIALSERHRHFDLEVREQHLKKWVAENGLGLPLYLTKMTEREADAVQRRIDGLEQALGDRLAGLEQLDRRLADLEQLHGRLDDLERELAEHSQLMQRLFNELGNSLGEGGSFLGFGQRGRRPMR